LRDQTVPPVGFIGLQSIIMSTGSRHIGLPRSPVEERFRPRRRFVRPTVPRLFRIGFILSCPLSPSEFLLRLSRSVPIRGVTRVPSHTGDRSCQDFLPHRDITGSVHDLFRGTQGFRTLLRSVHGLSQPLDGLLRHRLHGLVSSRGHVQGSLRPGVSPDPQLAAARHRHLPPCRSDARAHRQAGCHARARRLRGVPPRIDAFREPSG